MTRPDQSNQFGPTDLVGLELLHGSRAIGELEEIIDGPASSYFVVDCRHLTYGSKRLVPVGAVQLASPTETAQQASTALDPETIRDSPDFDPFKLGDTDYWDELDDHYAR